MAADEWIRELGLLPHPEGGTYAQTWRDDHSSAIYYALRPGEQSAWHRVQGRSELWHHYAGGPLTLHISTDGEAVESHTLGIDLAGGARPQVVVPAGAWQSAISLGEATLVGCTVTPPFTFDAFELAPTGWSPGRFGPLVSANWLAEHRDEVTLVDVRWYLDGRSGREAFEQGHLPGAVWMDLDTYLADPPTPQNGRHPLPSPDRFAAGMAAAGIGEQTKVVAYDDNGGMSAARLVWLLRALGHEAALLDGGLGAWAATLERGSVSPLAAIFAPAPWPPEKLADIDDVSTVATLIDARAPERYRGEQEPIDPRAGHIPGAVNVPWQSDVDSDGRLHSAAELGARFEAAGVVAGGDVVVYCGSGISACHTLLAMEASAITGARLFPGSWSQWSGDPDRPAATG